MSRTSWANRTNPLIVVCFALSGFASLTLEVVWFDILQRGQLAIGESAALVTGAYMAGLALGNLLGSRLSRFKSRLYVYVGLELLVAASALGFPEVLANLENVSGFWGWPSLATVLLVPTTAMGAGLPILATSVSPDSRNVGKATAVLYAANSGGAMLGIAGMGLLGIEWLGLTGASLVAAICLAAGALGVWFVASEITNRASAITQQRGGRLPSPDLLLAACAASAAGMVLQVAWVKLTASWVNTPHVGFSATVFAFLCGITLGSGLAGRMVRHGNFQRRALRSTLLGIALALLIGLLLARHVAPLASGTLAMIIAVLALLPATIGIGMLVPLLVALAARSGATSGDCVGVTGAASTAGAMLGTFVAASLLPVMGPVAGVCGSSAIYIFVGAAVGARSA